jgi:Na+/H+ antiporter NhaD/arsenite permease-like protein/mannitol/fructose-specific phosphotransferase system IIA component (Ntr-type)
MVKLDRFVHPDLAFDVPSVAGPEELFRFVADRLADRRLIAEPAQLAAEFLKREQQGSTGVGHGIALPHAVVDSAEQILVVVVRLGTPLAWDAVDNDPVRLLVFIVAPENQKDQYLRVLAELARSLNQSRVRERMLAARDPKHTAQVLVHPPHESFLMRNRRLLVFAGLLAATYLAARVLMPGIRLPSTGIYAEGDYAKFGEPIWLRHQELTVTLFLAMVVGTLLFWRYRVAIAAASLGVLLVTGVMDIETTVRFMSIPTILFIMSMMVIVRWLQNIGVFRYVVAKTISHVRGVPWLLLLVLMAFSVLLGGLADEVSAILVTFGLALEVSKRTKTPLVPYLLSLVFATNVGSALTLVGNPIGVYIAFAGKLNFEDFLRWATPVSALAAVAVAAVCMLVYRRHFIGPRSRIDVSGFEFASERVDPVRLRVGIITFLAVVVLVAFHRRLELLLGLGEGTALVAEALMVVGFIVFYEQERGRLLVERGIDWWTLLFFMFLFANAACLEYTGVTAKIGYLILTFAQRLAGAGALPGSVTGIAAVLLLWFSGLTSGFVDNLPVVAALVPVVKDLIRVGLPHASILWWALLFGGCFGGNLTVIGSTANLVAIGAFERVTGKSIRFRDWIRLGAVVTVVSMVIATAALLLQLPLAP